MSSSDVHTEDDDELSDTPFIEPRVARGSRVKALNKLRASLSEDSIESYKKLLDRTFQEKPIAKEDNFNTTQDGIVIWTPQEKRAFFELLDRKGRSGIREIATAIQSKSELEILEYIRLLQKGVRRQHFNDTHARTAILGDIPAAAEIRKGCCNALNDYAELLCLEEQRDEDRTGRAKHGGLWIIDEEMANKLEKTIAEDQKDLPNPSLEIAAHANETRHEKSPSIPNANDAATFFKLTNWILLSERLFMNLGGHRLGDNWVNVAFEGETPSMTADVLSDFYKIALTVTRRLVHATHFFASSRVRRNGKASRPSATVIKASDVRRAARTFDMRTNASEYWIGVARRCSLEVVDSRHRKRWNPIPLDYDEVEALLSQSLLPSEPYERTTPSPSSRERSNSIISDVSLDSLAAESNDSEDEHAEALDQQQSSAEELSCWTALGRTPPESPNSQLLNAEIRIPPKPPGKRKTTEELVDWRDRMLYRSEWEEYGDETEKLDSEFASQRKKRLTMASFRPLFESNIRVADETSKLGPDSHEYMTAEAETEAEFDYQIDDSDSEFRLRSPGRLPRSKSQPKSSAKPVASRTGSRKRTPVSYAPPQGSEFVMEMEVDSETGEGDADEGLRDTNDHQGGDYVSLLEKDFNGEYEDDEEDARVSSISDEYYHPSSPRDENLSLRNEGDDKDDGDDEEGNLLSGP
ncbi:hypothetical protein BDW72DRAFT_210635 [Aspergillus terricola var. indicus]